MQRLQRAATARTKPRTVPTRRVVPGSANRSDTPIGAGWAPAGEPTPPDRTVPVALAAETMYQALIDIELTATIGAGPWEHSRSRTNQRNGARPRTFCTPAGVICSCGCRSCGPGRSIRPRSLTRSPRSAADVVGLAVVGLGFEVAAASDAEQAPFGGLPPLDPCHLRPGLDFGLHLKSWQVRELMRREWRRQLPSAPWTWRDGSRHGAVSFCSLQ